MEVLIIPNNCSGDGSSIQKHSSFISRFKHSEYVQWSRYRIQIDCESCVLCMTGCWIYIQTVSIVIIRFRNGEMTVYIQNFEFFTHFWNVWYLETLLPFIGLYIWHFSLTSFHLIRKWHRQEKNHSHSKLMTCHYVTLFRSFIQTRKYLINRFSRLLLGWAFYHDSEQIIIFFSSVKC